MTRFRSSIAIKNEGFENLIRGLARFAPRWRAGRNRSDRLVRTRVLLTGDEWHEESALAFSATVTPSRTRARDLPVLASLPILALLPSRAKVFPFRTGPKGISLFGDELCAKRAASVV